MLQPRKRKTWWAESLAISRISKYVACIKFFNMLVKLLIAYIETSQNGRASLCFPKLSIPMTIVCPLPLISLSFAEKKRQDLKGEGFGVVGREVCFSSLRSFFIASMAQCGHWDSLVSPQGSRVNPNNAPCLRRALLLFLVISEVFAMKSDVILVQSQLWEIFGLANTSGKETRAGKIGNGRECGKLGWLGRGQAGVAGMGDADVLVRGGRGLCPQLFGHRSGHYH